MREQVSPRSLHTWTCANDLRVIVAPDKRLSIIHLHLCCLGGSGREPPDRNGLAHLCEHLVSAGLTEGGESYPELINRVGGTTHALTFHDRTTYADTLPSAQLALGIWAAARRLAGPSKVADLQRLDIERRILLEECLLQRERLPHAYAFEVLHRLLYPPPHPYHRPPAGSREGIGAITSGDIAAWASEHYGPSAALLVLVGDVTAEEAAGLVDREFGSLPAGQRPGGDPGATIEVAGQDRHLALADHVPQPLTYVAYRLPGYGSRAAHAAAVVIRALAVGRSSPLGRELTQDRRTAQDVRVCLDSMRHATTVAFIATGVSGDSSEALESTFVDAIERRLAEGITARDLEHGRKRALIDHHAGLQSLQRRAAAIACQAAFVSIPARMEEMAEPYRDLDRDEVNALARRFFRPERRAVLTLRPREAA